jgi:hypothetical protein
LESYSKSTRRTAATGIEIPSVRMRGMSIESEEPELNVEFEDSGVGVFNDVLLLFGGWIRSQSTPFKD